jgi:hypothetical protein
VFILIIKIDNRPSVGFVINKFQSNMLRALWKYLTVFTTGLGNFVRTLRQREELKPKFHLFLRIQLEIKIYTVFQSGTLPTFGKNFCA